MYHNPHQDSQGRRAAEPSSRPSRALLATAAALAIIAPPFVTTAPAGETGPDAHFTLSPESGTYEPGDVIDFAVKLDTLGNETNGGVIAFTWDSAKLSLAGGAEGPAIPSASPWQDIFQPMVLGAESNVFAAGFLDITSVETTTAYDGPIIEFQLEAIAPTESTQVRVLLDGETEQLDEIPEGSSTAFSDEASASDATVEIADPAERAEELPSEFGFDFHPEGPQWEFHNPQPPFEEVEGSWDPESRQLRMTPLGNENAFGYWEAPIVWLGPVDGPVPQIAGETGDGHVYIAEFTATGHAEDIERTPDMRLRTSARDFERSDVTIINSQDRGEVSPPDGSRTYTQLFHLPEGANGIRLNWDVTNFLPDQNDPGILLELEEASVELGDAALFEIPTYPFAELSFEDGETHGFTPRDAEPFINGPAEFEADERGLLIRGIPQEEMERQLSIDGEYTAPTTFGYWGLESDVQIWGNVPLRITATVEADGVPLDEEADVPPDAPLPPKREQVPVFRIRVNDYTLQTSHYVNIDSRGRWGNIPTDGDPITYTAYYMPPPEVNNENLIVSFDYLYSEESDHNPEIGLILTNLSIEALGD